MKKITKLLLEIKKESSPRGKILVESLINELIKELNKIATKIYIKS